MKTGNTCSMPGAVSTSETPQWSPVMKTGNTRPQATRSHYHYASMEPGHEDREYVWVVVFMRAPLSASMEPGHEDREYGPGPGSWMPYR